MLSNIYEWNSIFLCWTETSQQFQAKSFSVLLNDYLNRPLIHHTFQSLWVVSILLVCSGFSKLETSFSRSIFFIVHRLRYHSPTNLSSPGRMNNWNVVKWTRAEGNLQNGSHVHTAMVNRDTHSNGDTDKSYGEHIHIVMVDTDTQQSQTEWLFRTPENITITYWQIIVYW